MSERRITSKTNVLLGADWAHEILVAEKLTADEAKAAVDIADSLFSVERYQESDIPQDSRLIEVTVKLRALLKAGQFNAVDSRRILTIVSRVIVGDEISTASSLGAD